MTSTEIEAIESSLRTRSAVVAREITSIDRALPQAALRSQTGGPAERDAYLSLTERQGQLKEEAETLARASIQIQLDLDAARRDEAIACKRQRQLEAKDLAEQIIELDRELDVLLESLEHGFLARSGLIRQLEEMRPAVAPSRMLGEAWAIRAAFRANAPALSSRLDITDPGQDLESRDRDVLVPILRGPGR